MTGKINGLDNRPVQVGGQAGATRTAGKSASAPGAETASAARVRLTDAAVQLAALEKALTQVPDIDPARVQAMKAEIASGQYKVDSQRVAAKLMQLERALAAATTATAPDTPPTDVPGEQV